MTDYELIDLSDNNSRLIIPEATTRIGVDTEFLRERTYYAKLCLVQVATSSRTICIDPLTTPAADNFWREMMEFEWILHAARQDLEIVFEASNQLPDQVFDTQIAAAMLGFPAQIGYAGLVKQLFNVNLDKAYTRADWSKRPLSEALLKYAAEDVYYLLPAYESLAEQLKSIGRFDWALEDSQYLLDASLYQTEPAAAIKRLKGARKLQGRPFAVAKSLATWREEEAIRTNKPRKWVLSDRLLLNIAVDLPDSIASLARIDTMPEKLVQRSGKYFLQIIERAEPSQLASRRSARLNEKQRATLKKMKRKVEVIAHSLGIAAEIIASKKELSAAVVGNRKSRVFRGWRKQIIGKQLLELL